MTDVSSIGLADMINALSMYFSDSHPDYPAMNVLVTSNVSGDGFQFSSREQAGYVFMGIKDYTVSADASIPSASAIVLP